MMLFCWESASWSLCLPGALFTLALLPLPRLPLPRLHGGWLCRELLRGCGCEAAKIEPCCRAEGAGMRLLTGEAPGAAPHPAAP